MIECLMHRGPDDVGVEESVEAVLGATRLAIRGLTSGRQPIHDPESGVVVVCNGEIDNSRELRSWLMGRGRKVAQESDVGVLPGLYLELGDEFVERLIGAFAIAIWDPRARRLVLARDRAGERPLFYRRRGPEVHFATEIAALAADSEHGPAADALTPDREAIARYLRFGSFAAPETPFEEIRKVAPAEIVTFHGEEVRRRRYWRWPIGREPLAGTSDAGGGGGPGNVTGRPEPRSDTFDRIFREAVRRQSEVDVDYGAFLSGGIDSSLVAAVARAVRPDHALRAYTLRFGEPSYDEGSYAEQVAKLLGCESIPVWLAPEDIPPGIAELVRMVGEPLADPAWVPTALLSRRAAQEVKLALVGEGADELFGGYPTYLGVRAAEVYARWPGPVRRAVRGLVQLWPPSDKKVTISYLLKRFVSGAELDGVSRHLLWTSNIAPELLLRLGVQPPSAPPGPDTLSLDAPGAERSGPDRLLDRVQRIDLETSLAEGLLTKADRASMQSALELRAPFLDRDVMEFAATLPPDQRVSRLRTKVFLKQYALRYLPGSIVNRRKRGLSVPLSRWLRGPLQEWAVARLGDSRLGLVGVDPEAALAAMEEHRLRKADHARALWTVIVLDEWLRWVSP
jgi:asparagine synthase (glutamine-hydrolysing)